MTHCVRKSICDSFLSLFQNVHQIPIFLQIIRTVKMINENPPDNKNEGNYPVSKYMFKVSNRKKVLAPLSLALNIFRTLFVDFEHIIVHWISFFHYKYQRFMFYMHEKSSHFSAKFLKKCLLYIKSHLNDLKLFTHFRFVHMTLKSITFAQNH